MKPIRAVLFDLDGTLLYTLDNISASVNHVLSAHGMPTRAPREMRSFIGHGVARLMALAAPSGTDEATVAQLLSELRVYYAAHGLDYVTPYDGVMDMLERLKANGIAMAIVSNKPEFSTEELRQHFFADYIDVALGDSPDRPRKPAPEAAFLALSRLGVSAEEAVLVGDGDADAATAKNAGLPCIGVTWGFRDAADLLAAGATALADTPAQVVEMILEGSID
jgi:phosphoglycolate phosphatase